MEPKEIALATVFQDLRDLLDLDLLNRDAGLNIAIHKSDIGRPGLLLAGFADGFEADQIQVLGEAEVAYLESLSRTEQAEAFSRLIDKRIPCVIVTGPLPLPKGPAEIARQAAIPIFSTPLPPTQVVQGLSSYLLTMLAPETSLNGTLVDVYGTGILLRGKSGIGKSECALDLVERGHRLVADDLVRTIARPPGILIGRSSEPLQDYVEVRGIGLVDIGSIYGIRALRRQKRIEVEVTLMEWEKGQAYDRSGLEKSQVEILGVKLPSITVPLVPGKNVSVIVEVVALGHILKAYGYDAAVALDESWVRRIKNRGRPKFDPRAVE